MRPTAHSTYIDGEPNLESRSGAGWPMIHNALSSPCVPCMCASHGRRAGRRPSLSSQRQNNAELIHHELPGPASISEHETAIPLVTTEVTYHLAEVSPQPRDFGSGNSSGATPEARRDRTLLIVSKCRIRLYRARWLPVASACTCSSSIVMLSQILLRRRIASNASRADG